MAGQTDLSGSITCGPPNVTDNTFPSMTSSSNLHLTPNPKTWNSCTGVLSRNINSPSPAWVALDGVGPTSTVVHADFFYFRSNAPFKIRITRVSGIGTVVGDDGVVQGLLVKEVPSTDMITLVEVQGVGTVEHMASGPQ